MVYINVEFASPFVNNFEKSDYFSCFHGTRVLKCICVWSKFHVSSQSICCTAYIFSWENKCSSIKFKRTAITFESDLWTGGQIYVDIVKKVRTSHRSPVTLPKWLPAAGWVNISTTRSRGRWTFWQLIRLKNGPGCAITRRKQGPGLVRP